MTEPESWEAAFAPLWQDLLDVDDRTSPVEYPDHALITYEEALEFFHAGLRAGYEAAPPAPTVAAEPGDRYYYAQNREVYFGRRHDPLSAPVCVASPTAEAGTAELIAARLNAPPAPSEGMRKALEEALPWLRIDEWDTEADRAELGRVREQALAALSAIPSPAPDPRLEGQPPAWATQELLNELAEIIGDGREHSAASKTIAATVINRLVAALEAGR